MSMVALIRAAKKVSQMYPNGCTTGNECDWMLRGNCPVCVKNPIEGNLSVIEYRGNYPVEYRINIGDIKIDLCEYHLRQFHQALNEHMEEWNKNA